ncbi:acyl-CoA dehydrogenase NM domain-like protein [Mytilinidion resinicola]|uniref:Acyl-CoA dehydrogenase NM domain-like protein n=1 Tax=Mytilinidion resinicola TaxID=574789 RepID=A0A6A6Y1E2_9PEZI|nr:acyl-CoA dehydrogenase NM domain-like protein [Mytilinidion resinicola]KAF2802368.1 acyl-CoA dehydrogenase NM domain-like protein [Mytilinidion resinicola]
MADCITSNIPSADPSWHTDKHHPYYKDSHRRLQRFIREYIDAEVAPNVEEWERQGFVPEKNFKRHASLGFLAAAVFPLPKEYLTGVQLPGNVDAEEWDEFHDAILIDEMARCGCLGTVWGINGGATVGGAPLAIYASPEQKEKYLAPLLRGNQRHCLMITEPDAGSDVAGLTTTATKSADGTHYLISGQKKWVTQGQWASHGLVAARTGNKGAKGISVFIIPLNSPGVTRKKMENSGVSSSGSAFIDLDEVKVPAANLIGPENKGFEIVMSTFTHERLWVGITALRLGRIALEDAYKHALRRETFGAPLFANQVIRQKIAKITGLLEPTHFFMENLVYRSVRTSPLEFAPLAALLKVQAAHNLEKISREAQQIFGGLGYSRGGAGGRVEQISRDVRVLVVSGGSEEILMDMVAKSQKRLAKL